VSCGAAFAPGGPFPDLNPAFRGPQSSRRPAQAGFMKSSTMAFGEAIFKRGRGCSRVTRSPGKIFASITRHAPIKGRHVNVQASEKSFILIGPWFSLKFG
jgi:hypothetical protein